MEGLKSFRILSEEMEQRTIERIIIETGIIRPCLIHIVFSNETLTIVIHVSDMKCVRHVGI